MSYIVTDRKRLKCPACYAVEYEDEITTLGGKDGKQPICADCGIGMVPLCKYDHPCSCINPINSGSAYCPECGQPICPV